MRDWFAYVSLFCSAPEASRADPASLQKHLIELLDAFRADALVAGFSDREIELASFALVAWADELILAEDWNGNDSWRSQPLQLVRFDTVRAGNEFYERITQIGVGETMALEAFFYCLAMGFQGELVVDPERRNAFIRQLWEKLYAAGRVLVLTDHEEISASAYAWEFRDAGSGGRRVAPVLLGLALAVGAFYALYWAMLTLAARDLIQFVGSLA